MPFHIPTSRVNDLTTNYEIGYENKTKGSRVLARELLYKITTALNVASCNDRGWNRRGLGDDPSGMVVA